MRTRAQHESPHRDHQEQRFPAAGFTPDKHTHSTQVHPVIGGGEATSRLPSASPSERTATHAIIGGGEATPRLLSSHMQRQSFLILTLLTLPLTLRTLCNRARLALVLAFVLAFVPALGLALALAAVLDFFP